MTRYLVLSVVVSLFFITALTCRADSTVVFNEVMYHPQTNEAALEWIELHNQMAVDMDLSGWVISDGISFTFPEGTIVLGGGYLIVASSPESLRAASGLTNALGPFTGRLSNGGERLELRNNSGRQMDVLSYGTDGAWPVGPDGSGVSLAKLSPSSASGEPGNWASSTKTGGTPGALNFPEVTAEVVIASLAMLDDEWKFEDSGKDLGTDWRSSPFDDSSWKSGRGVFYAGSPLINTGGVVSIPTVFSTGLTTNRSPVASGFRDPHFQIIQSAQNITPRPPVNALVIDNHPAWAGNDTNCSWIGVLNPGTVNVAAGNYSYRTAFDLSGFDLETIGVNVRVAADNTVTDVLLNGASLGFTYSGFASFSPLLTITEGFAPGTNSLEFRTSNAGPGANPHGFRASLNAAGFTGASSSSPTNSPLAEGPRTHYFRKRFQFNQDPARTVIRLRPLVDDGAVFYLNGIEVYRFNLDSGIVSAATPASKDLKYASFNPLMTLPGSNLVSGENLLAVEVHQSATGNGDMAFGVEITTETTLPLSPPALIAFNELTSDQDPAFWLELANYGENAVDLTEFVLVREGAARSQYTLGKGPPLLPGGFVALSSSQLGSKPSAGDRLFLFQPGRTKLCDAAKVESRLVGRFPQATGPWLFPAVATREATNQFQFHDEIVINEIMYHHAPLPAIPAVYSSNTLVLSVTNHWKYHQEGIDLGMGWRSLGYDDNNWASGPALLQVSAAALPAPKGTTLALTNSAGQRITTWYFRTTFTLTNSSNNTLLTIRPIIDDGAVFYLNGIEILRTNMPSGTIGYTTKASRVVGTAAFGPAFSLNPTNLITGTNLLAVEVHKVLDNDDDVVFGTEMFVAVPISPEKPFRESPEAWLELYNRSSNSVNLSGWRLDEGIDYRFHLGTKIEPKSFLVIASDPSNLRSLYPDITIVGPYTNRLSHRGERLVLKDDHNNPADVVHYWDNGRWAGSADGRGSSLELRDPRADNGSAEAWASSDESHRVDWKTYTYRGVAASENASSPTQYREFVLGLLDDGEVLIDDISLVESPSGASPKQLLSNGKFENNHTGWRLLGNHRHSFVETDPENAGNHVLHLIATGPTEHMHNHAEITLSNNTAIVNGREYEISFRAKWLTGSRSLNTRLYFNKIPHTTVLDALEKSGSPGMQNTRFEANIGPTFEEFRHEPLIPNPGQVVRVSVKAADPDQISNLTLWYSVNAQSWRSIVMSDERGAEESELPEEALYSGSIPGQPAGSIVQFYVEGQDTREARSTFPSSGRGSRALYRVSESENVPDRLHSIRIIMTSEEATLLHASTNVMSNDRIAITVVYDDQEIFYNVGVHLQGSERGRDNPGRVGFTIEFPSDHLFRGVHDLISIDRSGGYSGIGGRHDEIVLKHIVNKAGGLPGMYDDLVYCIAPRPSETSTGLLLLAKYGDVFLDSQYRDGTEGNVHKMELIYYPTTVSTSGFKLPQPDEVLGTDISNLGNNKESYRWNFILENNLARDDFSGMIALGKAFSLTGASLDSASQKVMDVDEWMRAFAFEALAGVVDTYSHDNHHNFQIYFRPEDQKALALLWDMDFGFSAPTTDAFPPTAANLLKIISLPSNRRVYNGHLLDLMNTAFNTAYVSRWVTHYSGLLGQNWGGILTYINSRNTYVRQQLGNAVVFAITNNAGKDFMVTTPQVPIGGNAWFNVRTIREFGRTNGLTLTWGTPTRWLTTVPLQLGTNLLDFAALDFAGAMLASAQITVTSTATTGYLDTDRDGLPDDWERANGFDPLVAEVAEDADQDGFSNEAEYLAGTDPRDARSFLQLHANIQGPAIQITFSAEPGRSYTLLQRESVTTATWTSLRTIAAGSSNSIVETVLPIEGSTQQGFFKLITPALP